MANRRIHPEGRSLDDWLSYIEGLHTANIELGLERVKQVAIRAELTQFDATVVTVGGTNGKGTTCRVLETICLEAGLNVGVYSSPHLHDYRERVRINDAMLAESAFCDAFAKVERFRGEQALTYFEFGTLAALQLFSQHSLDLIILEVGLGGRLDATNIVDPDIAVVTTVDLDHSDWLGDTRESVGFEKAGIFRPKGVAVCGDLNPPDSLLQHAKALDCALYLAQRDFSFTAQRWHCSAVGRLTERTVTALPEACVPMMNVSTALCVLALLPFTFTDAEIRQGVRAASLPGRMQCLQAAPTVIADVAHNPQATRYVAKQLTGLKQRQPKGAKVVAVVGMLKDKDSAASLFPMLGLVDIWYLCSLHCDRAASATMLKTALLSQFSEQLTHHHSAADESILDTNNPVMHCCDTVQAGVVQALSQVSSADIVMVFGSFYTVAELLEYYKNNTD